MSYTGESYIEITCGGDRVPLQVLSTDRYTLNYNALKYHYINISFFSFRNEDKINSVICCILFHRFKCTVKYVKLVGHTSKKYLGLSIFFFFILHTYG